MDRCPLKLHLFWGEFPLVFLETIDAIHFREAEHRFFWMVNRTPFPCARLHTFHHCKQRFVFWCRWIFLRVESPKSERYSEWWRSSFWWNVHFHMWLKKTTLGKFIVYTFHAYAWREAKQVGVGERLKHWKGCRTKSLTSTFGEPILYIEIDISL